MQASGASAMVSKVLDVIRRTQLLTGATANVTGTNLGYTCSKILAWISDFRVDEVYIDDVPRHAEPFAPAVMVQRRVSAGLSQSRLAILVQVTERQIINYEKGRHAPTPAKLRALAEALSTTPQELAGTPPGSETLSDLRRFSGLDREEAASRLAAIIPGKWVWRLHRLEVGEGVAAWASSVELPKVVAALAEVYQVPQTAVRRAWARTHSSMLSSGGNTQADTGSRGVRSNAARTWEELNARQRTYLVVIFNAERSAERDAKAAHAAGRPISPAVWRKLPYTIKADPAFTGYTPIQETLRAEGLHDPGAGATLHALEKRGLVGISEDQVEVFPLGLVSRVLVELTRAGRACARFGLNEQADPRDGQLLSEWLWHGLAKVAEAGAAGLAEDGIWGKARFFLGTGYRPNGSPSRGYIHLVPVRQETDAGPYVREYRWHLTDAGRSHIDQYFSAYRQLYPAPRNGSKPLWT